MSNKLTDAQQLVLNKMRAGAKAHYLPNFWLLSENDGRKCTRQINALISLGLVKVIERDIYGHPSIAVISEESEENEHD